MHAIPSITLLQWQPHTYVNEKYNYLQQVYKKNIQHHDLMTIFSACSPEIISKNSGAEITKITLWLQNTTY